MITYRSAGVRPYLRPIVWSSPILYWPVALVRQRRNIFSRHFDIMIDGYQRSANTFATRAFELCQPFSIVVNSHNHNPAAVIAAVRMKKPVLILIRAPRDAIASWTVHSRYPLDYNIASYIAFYEKLMPHLNRICVAQFHEVSSNFAQVVERINARFRSSFRALAIDEVSTRKIFERIENDFSDTYSGSPLDELKVSRPSKERHKFKEWVVDQMSSPAYSNQVKVADQVYQRFSEEATRTNEEALSSSSSLPGVVI